MPHRPERCPLKIRSLTKEKQMPAENPIAQILNITPIHQTFTFEGRAFEYHPAGDDTYETLFTRWADASRCVGADVAGGWTGLEQALAVLLSHKFKKGVTAAERAVILTAFKARRF